MRERDRQITETMQCRRQWSDQTDGRTDRQTEKWSDRPRFNVADVVFTIYRNNAMPKTIKWSDRQTGRQTDRQRNDQTDRQTDRKMTRQTSIQRHRCSVYWDRCRRCHEEFRTSSSPRLTFLADVADAIFRTWVDPRDRKVQQEPGQTRQLY